MGYFIEGDVLWVFGSLILVALVSGAIHSPGAILATLAVASMIGTFAILQVCWGWLPLRAKRLG